MNDVIIVATKNPTAQGITLVLNKPARFIGRNGIASKEWFVSWDKIGAALFAGYTDAESVAELNALREKP